MDILLFNSSILTYIVIFAVIIGCILFDLSESSWGIFVTTTLFVVVVHFWSNYNIIDKITTKDFLLYCIIYFVIGFIYSVIRTYTTNKELLLKDEKSKKEYPNYYTSEKDKFNLRDHVYRWIFWWWVSLITWVIGKGIKQLFNIAYKKVEKFYTWVFNL